MTEFGETLIAEAPDAATPAAEPAPEFEAPRLVGRLRILDPTVAFGEEPKLPIASLAVYEQPDGTLTNQTLRRLNRAVGTSVEIMQSAERHVPQPVGAQTDPLNSLALTEHEAAVVARWQARDEARQEEATDTTGFLGVPLARVAIGIATGLAGLGGGLVVATPALAQPNQVTSPAAKIAHPFEFGLSDALNLDEQPLEAQASDTDTAPDTSLTPAEEQECVQIAVSGRLPTPFNERPTMFRAGIRPNTPGQLNSNEYVNGAYNFEPMPDGSETGEPDCSGIHRSANVRLQMEDANAKHRGRFFLLDKTNFDPDEYPDASGIVSVGLQWGATGSDIIFNQCPDGKHWLKVREKATIVAEDAQDDKALGSRMYNWPVKVEGSCKAAARSARLVTGFGVRK